MDISKDAFNRDENTRSKERDILSKIAQAMFLPFIRVMLVRVSP
jgi:hypothetical protein